MITSLQNPTIKNIIKLSKNKERREQNIFVLEGAREFSLALESNYQVANIFICKELFAKTKYPNILSNIDSSKITEISLSIFEKVAYRENSDGIIALMKPKLHTLEDLYLSDNPFIIILEAVEKPGNLGAILRTADAANIDAVIICDPQTDIYNANVIRSSVGGIFTVPVGICTSAEAINWLNQNNITSFAAELRASKNYLSADYTQPTAIVMGTEAEGLSDLWLNNADHRIIIPMNGKIDSLNVSVSTAIITFEGMRQRNML